MFEATVTRKAREARISQMEQRTYYNHYDDTFRIINEFKHKYDLVITDILKSYNDCKFAVKLETREDYTLEKTTYCIGVNFNERSSWLIFSSSTDDIDDFKNQYNYLKELCQ